MKRRRLDHDGGMTREEIKRLKWLTIQSPPPTNGEHQQLGIRYIGACGVLAYYQLLLEVQRRDALPQLPF